MVRKVSPLSLLRLAGVGRVRQAALAQSFDRCDQFQKVGILERNLIMWRLTRCLDDLAFAMCGHVPNYAKDEAGSKLDREHGLRFITSLPDGAA